MKKIIPLILILVLSMMNFVLAPSDTDAAVSDWWMKSASINPRWTEDFGSDSFKQSVRDLHSTGANMVTLIVPLFQQNPWSSHIENYWNTPTDASLIAGIDYVHSLGMKVDLKIHLESGNTDWRAHINPSDRETWFKNYGDKLEHYARIAQSHGVEQMVLGAELINMSTERSNPTNTQNWINLINRIRGVYSGHLSYSANSGLDDFVNEKAHIKFWGHLDSIGLAAYLPFNTDESVQSLVNEWARWDHEQIRWLNQTYGKPVMFTEIGYRSRDGARFEPWNSWNQTWPDQTEQANLYEALMSYWSDQDYMIGVSWWDWSSDPNAGIWSDEQGYTPQHKIAQDVMKKWFGSAQPTPTPTPAPSPVFDISGTLNQATASVNIKNTNNPTQSVNTDIEIHNSNGQRVFQRIYNNQNFGTNEIKTYNESWNPSDSGTYTLKVGVFDSAWNLHHWSDNVAQFTNANNPTPTPTPTQTPIPTPGSIDIWWPTNGATVSGTQPFKAMVQNSDVSQYKMFWQVDGDRLNEMRDNFEDYPHKEASVDLSGWTWKDMGPYILNFVANDLLGNLITQKEINININR